MQERKQFDKAVEDILQLTDKKKNPSLVYENAGQEEIKENVLKTLLRSKIKLSDFGLSKFKEDNNQKC